MMIWKKNISLSKINDFCKNTAIDNLGIEITEVNKNSIVGIMPVDKRTHQPVGLLHGGASVLFAETLGSIAGDLAVEEGFTIVGLEINANHVGGIKSGYVIGTATALHLGRTTQVWDIKIINKETKKTICISRLTTAVLKKD